jgi:hypothetical protein
MSELDQLLILAVPLWVVIIMTLAKINKIQTPEQEKGGLGNEKKQC